MKRTISAQFKQLYHVVWVVLFSLYTLACGSSPDLEAEKHRLLQTDIEFSNASEANGPVAAFSQYMSEDAMQLPHGAKPIFGREAIRESMSEGAKFDLTWEPKLAEVAIAGDLGYTWGTYTASWQGEDGEDKFSYGKYLNVWKKQPDGSWKVLIDMGNHSPAPDEAVQ